MGLKRQWEMGPEYVFGADFETDSPEDRGSAWMAQWAISDGDYEYYGTKMRFFEQRLWKLARERGNIFVYFHNLKFDSSFFLDMLKAWEERGAEVYINRRSGSIFAIQVDFDRDHSPMGRSMHIEFRDSLKKINADLREIGTMVGLPKLDGGDFHPGWSKELDMNNDDSWTYIKRDARIVAVAMRLKHSMGMTRATSAGDAWSAAKQGIYAKGGKRMWAHYFPRLPLSEDRPIRKAYLGGQNVSRHKGHIVPPKGKRIFHLDKHSMYPTVMSMFPLPMGRPNEMFAQPPCGLYIVHGLFKFKLKEGRFPWFNFKNKLDFECEGLGPTDPVVECREWHKLTLTNVDLELLIEWYDVEMDDEYPDTRYWAFDSTTGILKDYIDEHFAKKEEIKRLKKSKGKEMDAETDDGAREELRKQYASLSMQYDNEKVFLNSVYGRFGLNVDNDEVTTIESDDEVGYAFKTICEKNDDDYEGDCYIPFAAFVTAWARVLLLEGCAQVGPENVIHCDTDSIVFMADRIPDTIEVTKDRLGTWGNEVPGTTDRDSSITEWYEGGFKRYFGIKRLLEEFDPEKDSLDAFIEMAGAGIPQRWNLDGTPTGLWIEILDHPERIIQEIELGHEHYSIDSPWLRRWYESKGRDPDDVNTLKLLPKRVRGGTNLIGSTYKLSDTSCFRTRMFGRIR